MSPVVRWERVRLQGFGRHRDVTLAFGDGLVTWVAPNEAGKSTAVAGLVATVWGLPHLQEAAGFTWARFRSFDGGPHRGEVTLRLDGRRYTVARDFESHRVRVVHHADAGDTTVVEAEHNPNARREASAYLDWLRATLTIDDAALVLATFVVAQGDLGGSPHRVSQRVQALLVGAGGGTTQDAEARIEAALRACTRRLKGLAPGLNRDGRSDQALELAEARLLDLETRWSAGRAEADAYARIQGEAEATGAAARVAADEARRRRSAADAQRDWVDRREVAIRALRRAGELERAAATAHGLDAELAAARAAAAAVHPELAGVRPAGLEERVVAWARAEDALSAHERRLAAAHSARGAALAAAHDAVAAAIAAERSVVDPADALRWHPGESSGAGGAGLAGGAVSALAAAEAAARRWREGLAAMRRESARAAAAAAELAPVRSLAGLDDGLRAELHGYREAVAAWAARLQEAETAWQGWRERLDEAVERFGEVALLAPDAAADLIAFSRAEELPDAWAPWRWIGAAVATVVAAGLTWIGGAELAWIAGAGGGVALAWVLAWPSRPALRRARRRLDVRVAAGEAALDGDDDRRRELARRREAFDLRRDELAELAGGERAAAGRLADVRAGAAAFRERWSPWRAALIDAGADDDVDLGIAHDRFERSSADLADAGERAVAAARSLGVEADKDRVTETGVPDIPQLAEGAPAAAAGPDAARAWAWARGLGALGDDATVGDLDAWLARVGGATWSLWREAAVRSDALLAQRLETRAARERAEEEAVRVAREHERAVLAEETAVREARAALDAAHAAALDGAGGDDLPADAGALREAWRSRAAAFAHADALAAQLDAHLRAVAAADIAAVAATAEAAGWEAAQALREWRALVVAHPSLPPAEVAPAADDPDSLTPGDVFAAARVAADAAERAAAVAAEVALAAQEALARAQGADPVDVAAVELEIAAARDEVAHWALERDALALAATELAAAAEGFRAGHARRLEAAATAHLAAFTGAEGRRVRLGADLRAEVVETDGRALSVAQLSQGARDQLALALRFAVADLMADDAALPLVLDDPFLNWDAGRAAEARRVLREATARGRQVWLLSHRPEVADWGEPLAVEGG